MALPPLLQKFGALREVVLEETETARALNNAYASMPG